MKFLIYIPQLIFGGAEKVLVSFANDLVRRGHQVEVLELYEKGLLRPQFDSRVTFDAICSKAYTEKYYASLQQVKEKPWLVGKLAFSKVVGYRRYAEKLAAIITQNDIQSVTIVRMEVPCCGGIENAAKRAILQSGKFLPWQVVTITMDGRIKDL